MRKFISTTGFADGTQHVEYEGQQGVCVFKDGTRHACHHTLDNALEHVADGDWHEVLPAKRYNHRDGFQCGAIYVGFAEGATHGRSFFADGSSGEVEYTREQAEQYAASGAWIERLAPRLIAKGKATDPEFVTPESIAQAATDHKLVTVEGRLVPVTYKNGRYYAKVDDDLLTCREWHAKDLTTLQARIDETQSLPTIVGVVLQERGGILKYGFMHTHSWRHAQDAAEAHWQLQDYQHVLTYDIGIMMYWLDTWNTPHTMFDRTLTMEAK